MNQLTQQLKSGKMDVVEVPVPQLQTGQVLVQNFYSVISAGTEGKTVSDARKGYIAKARSRKKEVKQVIDLIRSQGLKSTYDMVMNKLEAPSPLGYSCAGEVIAVGEGVTEFRVGDHVACGGTTASHAEIVAVPKKLCAKLNPDTELKEAAFVTVSSIALQGIRQAEMQLGGSCVVIGMGLIGILTMKLLKASGIKALGVDISVAAVKLAQEKYGFRAALRDKEGLLSEIQEFSGGHGVDAVIITAGSSSTDPVNFAGEIARKKGKVVVVGAVPTGFERKDYYRKEIDLRMSCSYGPGRYDPQYENEGVDYPIGFARWTEQRNMQAICDLLAEKKLHFEDVISHIFSLDRSPEAYDLILKKEEPYLGILIEYEKPEKLEDIIVFDEKEPCPGEGNIGVIGSGSFANNVMLPILHKEGNLTGIATTKGINAFFAGHKYHFQFGTVNPERLLSRDYIDTVFILTRHNLHARQVIDSLYAGKHTFVEKPLCLTLKELEEIAMAYSSMKQPRPHLMVGFNRRFSPAVQDALKYINTEVPRAINMRINAGNLPPEHWVHDPQTGGGRIIGEGCHFIDLAAYLAGSKIVSVSASAMQETSALADTVNISLNFENGSIANISYFSNGNKKLAKEKVEVFSGGTTIQIHDFKSVEVVTAKRTKLIKYKRADKGHTEEVRRFLHAIKDGGSAPISFEEIINSMLATLLVTRSLNEGRTISLYEVDGKD